MQQPSIKTPGSIWAKLIDQNAAQAKKPEGRGDAFVYVVGPRSAGKSTLLNRFLYPNRADAPKPSEGLEYTYARRPSAFDHEKKDLAHFWEIGSGAEFMDELACTDKLFLTAKEVANAVLVVTVDLSDPAAALPALLTWLDLAQRKLTTTYHKFEKRGLQLPEHLRIRAKNKLYASNEDKDVVQHTGIAIVIAATKYDALRDKDPELKKVVGRTLRYIAHANGAFLTYLSGLHGGSPASETGKDTASERALLDNFTKLMNHLVFTGLDKKPSLKTAAQTDHAGPLWVPAGSDRFRDIGWPRGGSEVTSPQAGIQEWRAAWERLFPPKEDAAAPAPFVIDDRYREEEVDAAAARKLQEAEAQRKELERGKEATKRRSVTEGSATAPVKDSKPAPGVVAPPPPAPAATVKNKASSSSKAATGTIKAG